MENTKITKESIWSGPIAWMVKNNVAANLLMWGFLLGGLLFMSNTRQEVMPPFELDMITITMTYSGATAEEIEEGMVMAIEEKLYGVEGVKTFESRAYPGTAFITVEAVEGIDSDKFVQDIENEIERITTFPEDADEPVITPFSRAMEVVELIISGTDDELFLREWADNLEAELLLQPNISQVSLDEVSDKEIKVEIKQDTLRAYGITLTQVANAIRLASIEQGAGVIETINGDISIKVNDRRDYAEEFAQIPIISLADGSRVLLGDIASVEEGFEDSRGLSEYNGQPAILLEVYRVGDQTPEVVALDTLEVVERFNETMPVGLYIDVRDNDADVFIDQVDLLVSNAGLGIILVLVCLTLFLEPKLAFWVSLGVPMSIFGSFLFIEPYGVSINMMSLFAFILTLGIVVDDAIVVGENVHIWRRRGYTREEAAVLGTKEIAVPIVFSVLTNMVAFMPLMMVPGVLGLFFAPITPVVIAVFACSLIESLFVLPCHLAHDKKSNPNSIMFRLNAYQRKFSFAFTKWVERVYGPLLHKILTFRYAVVALCLALLIISTAFIISGRLGMELMPQADADYAFAEITVPSSTSEERLQAIADQLNESAQAVIEENGGDALAEGVYINSRGSRVQARLYLTDPEVRPLTTTQVTELWKEKAGTFTNVETVLFQADSGGGPGAGKAFALRLSHGDNDILQQAAEDLAEELRQFPQLSDIDTGSSRNTTEYSVNLTPHGEKLGFTSSSISEQLRAAFQGITVLRQQRGNEEITVNLSLPEDERSQIDKFEQFVLRTSQNEEVLLKDVVEITETSSPVVIRRIDGQRTLNVTANANPRNEVGLILQSVEANILPELAANYPGLSWQQGGMQEDINESMSALIMGLGLVVLAIYVLLAIPFKSYTQPFIIMIAMPFGIIGAIGGHLVMGYDMSIISIMGILALCGLVVNDSLMLVSFANNEQVNDGHDAYTAMHNAGIRRFRPILLTTLTTFLGLAPMIFQDTVASPSTAQIIPVAISLGFGVLFATVINLALVPALYTILDEIVGGGKKKKH